MSTSEKRKTLTARTSARANFYGVAIPASVGILQCGIAYVKGYVHRSMQFHSPVPCFKISIQCRLIPACSLSILEISIACEILDTISSRHAFSVNISHLYPWHLEPISAYWILAFARLYAITAELGAGLHATASRTPLARLECVNHYIGLTYGGHRFGHYAALPIKLNHITWIYQVARCNFARSASLFLFHSSS